MANALEVTTTVEDSIMAMLAERLDLADPPGLDDDLFALGADSVMAAQVFNTIQARYGVELDIERAFSTPTVRALARLVEEDMARAIAGLSDEEAQRMLAETSAPAAPAPS